MLDYVLQNNIRLMDYEVITKGGIRGGERLVAFSHFAGIAGAIDFLRGLGERYLSMGYSTPFLSIAATYMYPDLDTAYNAVKACGEAIRKYGLHPDLCPFNTVITGAGRVAKGAKEVWDLLPVKWVDPFELKDIVANTQGKDRTHTLYACMATAEHMVRKIPDGATTLGDSIPEDVPVDVSAFDKGHYKKCPEQYEPIFHVKVAPYASSIINCMYWEAKYPRILTVKQTSALHAAKRLRLVGISDISCDFEGSIEFLHKFTSIEKPYYVWNPATSECQDDMDAPGILFHAVDHLPSECPRDASQHFGSALMPFLPQIAASDGSKPFDQQDDLSPEIRGCIIASNGKLTPTFEYIHELRAKNEELALLSKKKILVLGSGYVAGPLVEYLLRNSNYVLTIASMILEEAKGLAAGFESRVNVELLNVSTDQDKLHDMVGKHDLVISLLPATMHVPVAKAAIHWKKNMVTASYISPEMAELNAAAQEAGITILNEAGLDPGIDHISAMRIIDNVQSKGGVITSFTSLCGGLPAPDSANNPLGYKWSWFPKGAMLALLNEAQYKKDGKIVNQPRGHLLESAVPISIPGFPNDAFEFLPNRDSISYAPKYNIDTPHLDKMFRGTLRYRGFSASMLVLSTLGFLKNEEVPVPTNAPTLRAFLCSALGVHEATPNPELVQLVHNKVFTQQGPEAPYLPLPVLEKFLLWIGLLSEVPVPYLGGNRKADPPTFVPIDTLIGLFDLKKDDMNYAPNEKDMALMVHEFIAAYPNGRKEKITATLVEYAKPTRSVRKLLSGTAADDKLSSAMSRTVGITAAIGADLILASTYSILSLSFVFPLGFFYTSTFFLCFVTLRDILTLLSPSLQRKSRRLVSAAQPLPSGTCLC